MKLWYVLFVATSICALDSTEQTLQRRTLNEHEQWDLSSPYNAPYNGSASYVPQEEDPPSTCCQYVDCCGMLCLVGLAICLDICGCRRR